MMVYDLFGGNFYVEFFMGMEVIMFVEFLDE